MVIQDNERNAYDQRSLEWELVESYGYFTLFVCLKMVKISFISRHAIRLIRRTFSELSTCASLSLDKTLLIDTKFHISIVYFRAGYTPDDYPTQSAWDTRLLLERSKAIKCPSVALQLAGAKKVQQVLASEEGLLEHYMDTEAAARLRATFMSMWPMDDSDLGKRGLDLAQTQSQRFVLKPQREGGGNNIYQSDIPPFLTAMHERDKSKPEGEPKEREGYILMELIQPPKNAVNVLVRAGTGTEIRTKVISELGIYGVALYRRDAKAKKASMEVNLLAGHLLRTKGSDSHEGGVVVGASGLDSVLLVDLKELSEK